MLIKLFVEWITLIILDRQKQIFKSVKQNNITIQNEFDNEHLKKTQVLSTSPCSQHESTSDLSNGIVSLLPYIIHISI